MFPGKAELVTLVKTGSPAGRTHTLNNPQAEYIGSIIVQEYRVTAFTTEMCEWQFSPMDSSFLFVLTDCPDSYSVAQTQF